MADHESSSIELTQHQGSISRISNTHEESAPRRQEFSLPPADGGKDAWLVLVAGFILEALVWGFPFSFGVFQEYYASHEFADQKESLAAIGTTATGVLYFAAPLVYAFLSRFPQWRKACSVVGFVILTVALLAASFATTVPQLLATQGVMYAVGGAIHYFPVFAYLDEWWITKKGVAYGVVMAGAGASGVVIPFVMKWCLTNYGYQTALRVWAVVSVVFTIPALFFLKGRLPERHAASAPRTIEWRFLKTSTFWVMEGANVLTSLGYFFPTVYLPSFAQSVGLTPISGTIAVSLLNGATVIGTLLIGVAVDRYHVTTAFNICAIGTILSVFLFWSFAVYTPVLFLFAIMYGLTGGGSSATWAGVVKPVREKYPAVDAGMIVTMMAAGKGLGAVISGPISGVLVSSDTWKNSLGYGFGSGYGYLITLTGVTASFGLIGWCGKKCGLV